jgi:hypothetical protein
MASAEFFAHIFGLAVKPRPLCASSGQHDTLGVVVIDRF